MGRTLLLPHTWGYHGLPGGCRSINIWIIWGIRAITRALFFALLRRNVPNPLGVRMPTMMAWTTASCRWWPPLRRSNGSNGPGETSWWRMNGFYKTIIDRILINASHCIYIYRLKKSTRFRWGLVLFLVATLRTCSLRQLQPSLTRPWRWRLLRWPARCCAFLMDGNGWEDVVFLDVNHITLW